MIMRRLTIGKTLRNQSWRSILPCVLVFSSAWSCSKSSPDERAEVQAQRAMEALPYLAATPIQPGDEDKVGVIVHDEKLAFAGINVYPDRYGPNAFTMVSMSGRTLYDVPFASSTAPCDLLVDRKDGLLQLCEDGIYVTDASGKPTASLSLDRLSEILSVPVLEVSHDIEMDAQNRMYAIISYARDVVRPGTDRELRLRDNAIAVFTMAGEVSGFVSMFDLFAQEIPAAMWDQLEATTREGTNPEQIVWLSRPGDVFHTNTIQRIGPEHQGALPGDVLTCLKHLDTIAVVDIEQKRLIWSWGAGVLDRPHHPAIEPDGTVRVFDNGNSQKSSRLVFVDPKTRNIVREYGRGAGDVHWFTSWGGSAELLPNGNYLIAEASAGRALEITNQGKLVWEYWTHPLDDEWIQRMKEWERGVARQFAHAMTTRSRRAIYRMERWQLDQIAYPQLRAALTAAMAERPSRAGDGSPRPR